MKASLRALLEGIVDYAGLFPPARLPLEEALRNYARYRLEPEAWMLARFVCPAARLAELDGPGAELFSKEPPFAFSVLASGGETPAAFGDALGRDLEHLRRFCDTHGRRVEVDVLEARLPGSLLEAGDAALRSFLAAVDARVRDAGPSTAVVFYEVPLAGDWRPRVHRVAGALAADGLAAGFKVRTGGLEAAAFPPPDQVAAVVNACRQAGVRFKATAGLHHPVRRHQPEVETHMHGFVNLFAAAALARVADLDEAAIASILAEEDPTAFRFEDEALSWREHRVPADGIRAARRTFAVSFGSCSFDEPREDLTALGLLP